MLSPFLKEHKKNLKKLTKKQLIQQIIIGVDMNATSLNLVDKLQEELGDTQEALRRSRKLLNSYKHFESLFIAEQLDNSILNYSLKSAESAIRYYENMNIWNFLKSKFR